MYTQEGATETSKEVIDGQSTVKLLLPRLQKRSRAVKLKKSGRQQVIPKIQPKDINQSSQKKIVPNMLPHCSPCVSLEGPATNPCPEQALVPWLVVLDPH